MKFTDDELQILKKLNINPNVSEWSDDDYCNAEEAVGDELTAEVVNADMKETEYSKICENLLYKIIDA